MSTIGERLREIRGSQTLEEFANANGIHRVTLSRLEKGERVPDANFLQMVTKNNNICSEWLLLGEGPMRTGETTSTMADTSAIPPSSLPTQPIENVSSPIQKMADMSAIAPLYEENRRLYQKNMELQERLLKVSEDKAELQVALERATMNIERRDMRIRELEEENARLREAQKGAASVQHDAGWKAV